ncbi:hypothetical protein Tco_0062691 [Tanacetum coccineum]
MGEPIPDKTYHQKEVEVEDPKVVAAWEKKKAQAARAAAKQKEGLKRGGDEAGSSKPKHKKRKTIAQKENVVSSDHSFHNLVNLVDDGATRSPSHIEPFVNVSGRPLNTFTKGVFGSESNADRSPKHSCQRALAPTSRNSNE